jgi:Flp pilus assembly protein TadG
MRHNRPKAASMPQRFMSAVQRFGHDETGTTAVEFGLIALPFTAVLVGMMMVCVYYFKQLEVENAVYQSARDLRVGNLQQGLGAYNGQTPDQKADQFKVGLCQRMANYNDCMTNMRVLVDTANEVKDILPPNCKDGSGNIVSNAAAKATFSAGGASSVVVATACYEWGFGGPMPFLNVGSLPNGSYLIQATHAIRTEPYN